jgi:hypothetical protein
MSEKRTNSVGRGHWDSSISASSLPQNPRMNLTNANYGIFAFFLPPTNSQICIPIIPHLQKMLVDHFGQFEKPFKEGYL